MKGRFFGSLECNKRVTGRGREVWITNVMKAEL